MSLSDKPRRKQCKDSVGNRLIAANTAVSLEMTINSRALDAEQAALKCMFLMICCILNHTQRSLDLQ